MKKKTLRNVILLVCVLALVAVAIGMIVSADEGKVVYVSANGTGDGTSASSPLGNGAGYDDQLAQEIANMPSSAKSTLYTKNALYKAYQQIFATGKDGTIVIVGDVAIDCPEYFTNTSFSYFYTGWKDSVTVTLTSNYGGTDYRQTNGAKLVLDRTKAASVNFLVGCKSAMKDLDVEYRYNNNVNGPAKYENEFMFLEYAKSFLVDTGVNVISKNYTDPNNVVDGDRYPTILGGRRTGGDNWIGDKSITLKSGTWTNVIGGQHGEGTEKAEVKSVTITVDGAKVGAIYGAGSPVGKNSVVLNNATIKVNSGAVGKIFANNSGGIKGALSITVEKAAKVGEANFADGTPTNTPTSTTLTYHRTALDEANVKGFAGSNVTVTPVGLPEGQKVIYVANVARGNGDGTSPENAMGHNAGYAETLANGTDAEKKLLYKDNVLYKALSDDELLENGGYIVFVGETTVDVSESMRTSSMTEFPWAKGTSMKNAPQGKKNITFTSIDPLNNGKDYRTEGAKFVLDVTKTCICLDIRVPQTWENVTIEHKYDSSVVKDAEKAAMFSSSGKKIVMGTGIEIVTNDVSSTKRNVYPTVIGGHRWENLTVNPDVTIKSGTWGAVFAAGYGTSSNGKVTGNVTVTVEGGKVELLSGATRAYGAWVDNIPVNGNINITINGGEVTKLYGAGSAGLANASNSVTVTVSANAKVGSAYSYHFVSETKNGAYKPANSTITYNADALKTADIYYFTTLNKTGGTDPNPDEPVNPPTPPATQTNVIYVSSVAKGTGDGSSPENAMGNDAGYAETLANGTTDEKKQLYKKNALYKAFGSAALADGGTIVIVGETVVDTTENMYFSSLTECYLPKTTKTITITSIDPATNKDYRTEGAKFVLDSTNTLLNLGLMGPTVWENLNIENRYDSSKYTYKTVERFTMISCNGNKTVFGEGLTVTANDLSSTKLEIFPTIIGGSRWDNKVNAGDFDLTIKSGTWGSVFGANFGVSGNGNTSHNVTINVMGGKIVDVLTGTTKNVNQPTTTVKVTGDVTINVTGGEVAKIIGVNQNGFGAETNKLTVTVSENAKVGSALAYDADYSTEDKRPVNSTINYNADALKTANVLYFTTVNKTGGTDEPVTPPTPPSTDPKVIYVASIARGTGDGSSPENAMGNDDGYANTLANGTTDEKKQLYKKNALYKAFSNEQLSKYGGTVVIVGETVVDVTENMYFSSLTELYLPQTTKTVTITSIDPATNKDYRTEGAKFVLDSTNTLLNLGLRCPTVWENLNIENRYDSSKYTSMSVERYNMITCNGNKTVFGTGLTVTSNDLSSTKVEIFPTVVAGSRWDNKKNAGDFDVTIKSGTWGSVFGGNFGVGGNGNTAYNTTINVEGGKIVDVLTGTIKNVNQATTTASFSGNVTINVTGGEVAKIIGASHNGLASENSKLTVTIGENAIVGSAWAYDAPYSTEDKRPVNSTITFNYKAIREDEVLYFTTKNALGDPDDQPVIVLPVIYVADKAKGNGDGSSPENAMGHDADYYTILANGTEDAKKQLYKKNVIYKALSNKDLIAQGGTVVLVGETTVDTSDKMILTDLAEFHWPKTGDKNITFTSTYDGVDYAKTNGAKLVLDRRYTTVLLNMTTPTTWDNLTIEHKYDSANGVGTQRNAGFAANGKGITIGANVKVIATDVNANPVEEYPTIIGGHRWSDIKTNTNVTIKSGTWGAVLGANWGTTSVGTLTGNVTVTIDGGKIEYLTGSNKDTETTSNAVVNGNIKITINGGEVTKLVVANHNGIADKYSIDVTIADGAKVGKAFAYNATGANADKQPANSTITYASSSIRADEIKYFTTATMVGDPSLQPAKVYYTLYIANVAKGKGDGSSPENAMGHDAGYYDDLAKAIEISKIKSADRTDEQNNFIKALVKKNVLYKALNDKKLKANGGKVVLVGETTLDVTTSMRQDNMSEFSWPQTGYSEIIFTSVDNGVDYRKDGAKLVMDVRYTCLNFDMKGPTVWENITIEHLYDSATCYDAERAAMFSGNCFETVFGEGIEVIATDVNKRNIKLYPTIVGGHRYSDLKKNSDITIKSGTWGSVFGANFGTSTVGNFTGNVNITVEGGMITMLSGGNKNTNVNATPYVKGDITINVIGGTVRKIMGTSHNGLEGEDNTITVTIADGARVGKAWGFHYTEKLADKQPKNSTITYASSAIRAEDVMYFGTATMVGDPSLAPEEMFYTIYIADKSKGTGDGSSPENAMGHDSDYASDYKKALKYAQIDSKQRTDAQKEVINNLVKKHALYKAMMDPTLKALGGKIVVVGTLTLDVSNPLRKSFSEFTLPGKLTEKIVITSKDNGVDYRKQGAKIVFDITQTYGVLTMNAPTLWEYLNIEHKYNSDNGAHIEAAAMIACNGYETEFGRGIYTYTNDIGKTKKENYITIIGGHRYNNLTTDTSITIRSGTWGYVLGGNFGTATMGKLTGNVDILVTGGKISRIIGTNKAHTTNHKETVHGNVRIRIWGGEVDIIYGTNNNGLKNGYVSVSIGKGAKVNQAYGYHPNYKGTQKVYAYLYYHVDSIAKNKIYNFILATPQTSSSIAIFVGVAALAGAGAFAVGSKSKKRRIK